MPVAVKFSQIVKVVDHESKRLFDAFGRHVCCPIDLLDTRTVAQVETRHRVGWTLVNELLAQIVRRTTEQPLP